MLKNLKIIFLTIFLKKTFRKTFSLNFKIDISLLVCRELNKDSKTI